MPRALHDGTLALAICRTRAAGAEDERTSWKVGGRDNFNQLINSYRWIIDIGQARLDHFTQIVRRDVGRHADSDAASAIDQKVRETGRENLRFFTTAIIIRLKINRVLIKIIQKRVCDLVEPCLGITH